MRHHTTNFETGFFIKMAQKFNSFKTSNNLTYINPFKKIYTFYRDGFKGMVLGKKLWKIILIKLFIMFAILKFFFFPNFLNTNFTTNEQRSEYVLEQITKGSSFHTQEVPHE